MAYDLFDLLRLHLTLVVLKLITPQEVSKATAALQSCQAEVNEILMSSGGLRVELNGLEYMNDDPSEVGLQYGCIVITCWQVDVLYMKVGHTGATVKAICDIVASAMIDANVLTRQQAQHQRLSTIKLHATLMNTRYRSVANTKQRQTFDASKM